jgi:hypothetical protein
MEKGRRNLPCRLSIYEIKMLRRLRRQFEITSKGKKRLVHKILRKQKRFSSKNDHVRCRSTGDVEAS